MPDRTRPIRKEICLNEQELNLIQHKMRQLGTHNFGAYARKMLIDGYIIKVDFDHNGIFHVWVFRHRFSGRWTS